MMSIFFQNNRAFVTLSPKEAKKGDIIKPQKTKTEAQENV